MENEITERILFRLEKARAKEPLAWERDSYQIAWHTVLLAAQGAAKPWHVAFAKVVGISPAKWRRQHVYFLEFHGLKPRSKVFAFPKNLPKKSARIPKKQKDAPGSAVVSA